MNLEGESPGMASQKYLAAEQGPKPLFQGLAIVLQVKELLPKNGLVLSAAKVRLRVNHDLEVFRGGSSLVAHFEVIS